MRNHTLAFFESVDLLDLVIVKYELVELPDVAIFIGEPQESFAVKIEGNSVLIKSKLVFSIWLQNILL